MLILPRSLDFGNGVWYFLEVSDAEYMPREGEILMKRFAAVLLVVALMMSFAACSAEQKIVGTWKNETTALGLTVETTYTFREDGTGTMTTILVPGLEFTYKVSGDVLTITTSVLGVGGSAEYEMVYEKDTMTMTSSGESLTLTKVK